jgi:ABC-type phosphate transport system permease subunit
VIRQGGERECKEWLFYWLIFCFSTIFVQQLRWVFFFLSWKSYNVARMLGYLLLFHPEIKGTRTLYNSFIDSTPPTDALTTPQL